MGSATTTFTDGSISGSLAITGSLVVSESLNVVGDMTVGGTLTSDLFITQITTRSVDFSTGSNQFGDTLDDTHQFTGSLSITGSGVALKVEQKEGSVPRFQVDNDGGNHMVGVGTSPSEGMLDVSGN